MDAEPALPVQQAERWALSVDRLVLTNGQQLTLQPAGVTAIVGGNNVGKSTLLNELGNHLAAAPNIPAPAGYIIQSIVLSKSGDEAELLQWLDRHAFVTPGNSPGSRVFRRGSGPQHAVDSHSAAINWRIAGQNGGGLGPLSTLLVHRSDIGSRISSLSGVQQRADPSEHPPGALSAFEFDRTLFSEFSALCQRIFRQSLTLDYLGNQLQIRAGTVDLPAPPIDNVTLDYRRAMQAVPLLSGQGDGMRNMLGLILPIWTASYPVVILDEPEAYLHPPQAFELGRVLARIAVDRQTQVIVATHDRDFLVGLLAATAPVAVVHLDRGESSFGAAQISSDQLQSIRDDPTLYYSNVLDGLFSKLVVVAEGDVDCRFFAAALEAADREKPADIPPSEVLFVSSSGKDGMYKVSSALHKLGVSVVLCPDLDVLNDETTLRRMVESVGADWNDFRPHFAAAVAQFKAAPSPMLCDHVAAAVAQALEPYAGQPYTEDRREDIVRLLRSPNNPWDALKDYGMAAFKTASCRHAADTLLARLNEIGIRPVREGELESLVKVEARKGLPWLAKAMADRVFELPAAKAHARYLVESQ